MLMKRLNRLKFWRKWVFWKTILGWKDYICAHCINRELVPLHDKLNAIMKEQVQDWPHLVYCGGYYYQGLLEIGINGIKPSEKRLERYGIHEYLKPEKSVLDIGSNAGFFACHLSKYVKSVDGVELNPYLIRISNEVKSYLSLANVNFHEADFTSFTSDEQYGFVFSLSNHHTIDGNLDMNFEEYISKIFDLLEPGGFLFFESHNIYGDDSDLEKKFLICSKYYELIKYKMIKAFYRPDIDKLFAIFHKKEQITDAQKTVFSLESAQYRYEYYL